VRCEKTGYQIIRLNNTIPLTGTRAEAAAPARRGVGGRMIRRGIDKCRIGVHGAGRRGVGGPKVVRARFKCH
jgi:hypothetical protein